MKPVAAAAVALSVLATACSGTETAQLPYNPGDVEPVSVPSTLVADPPPPLEPAEQRLVEVHASWLCVLQDRTFASPSEIPDALAAHLAAAGVSGDEYEDFAVSLSARSDLRTATLFAVQQTCFG